jgi:ABC-type polar amino acid transport system ATPase subunit
MFDVMKEFEERGETYFSMSRLIKKSANSSFKFCICCYGEIKIGKYYCNVSSYEQKEGNVFRMHNYFMHKNCAKNIQQTPVKDYIDERRLSKKNSI